MIIGTDEFSGAKKFFKSNIYKKMNIKNGRFDKNSLKIIEGDLNNE